MDYEFLLFNLSGFFVSVWYFFFPFSLVSKLENEIFLSEERLQCSPILLLVYHNSVLMFTVPITLY